MRIHDPSRMGTASRSTEYKKDTPGPGSYDLRSSIVLFRPLLRISFDFSLERWTEIPYSREAFS